jgi:hypothetical protein
MRDFYREMADRFVVAKPLGLKRLRDKMKWGSVHERPKNARDLD